MLSSNEIKDRGKADMKANYGLCLAISLIMGALAGGSATYSSSNGAKSASNVINESGLAPEQLVAIFAAIMSVIVVIIIVGFVLKAFLINPLMVGCQNFFVKNCDGPAQFSDLGRAFKPSWFNNVVTMFLADLFLGLWYCLFIIPGIVKTYSYRFVPFIMAENPEMKGTEAITLSRKLMNGNKWRAFCFDLSFIGWFLLAIISCGIVGVFYTSPYYNCACAEFYKAVKEEKNGQI